MRNSMVFIVGVVIALSGVIFTLQGVGLLKGSTMSNTTTWSVAGPIIAVIGLVIAWRGGRKKSP